jgi:hypothetical protein
MSQRSITNVTYSFELRCNSAKGTPFSFEGSSKHSARQCLALMPISWKLRWTSGHASREILNVAGLPDIAVKESRERIKSALRNCGFDFPSNPAVTVNLAPADIRKEGSAFDLPMHLAWSAAEGRFSERCSTRMFSGRTFARWRRAFSARRPFRGVGT